MRSLMIIFLALLFFHANHQGANAIQPDGLPIGFIGGCESDLNADGDLDTALLVSTSKDYELIVIMRLGEHTKSYIVNSSKFKRFLTCESGMQIKETTAHPGKGKVYKTNGQYLLLTQPESSAVAYFWSEGKFKEVWLSD
jgi:hypothetical protein